jgi:hypothetical protein
LLEEARQETQDERFVREKLKSEMASKLGEMERERDLAEEVAAEQSKTWEKERVNMQHEINMMIKRNQDSK